MSIKHDQLRSLAALCRRFGGTLTVVSQEAFDDLFEGETWTATGLSEAPFTDAHGIHWQRRIVYAVRGREEVGSIIHEMGHIFADLKPPDDSSEWEWFGWEVAVARRIGAGRVWSRQNASYNVADHKSWGGLTASERRAVVSERLAHAKEIKVVDLDGSPMSLHS